MVALPLAAPYRAPLDPEDSPSGLTPENVYIVVSSGADAAGVIDAKAATR
jgi:hypothetical protein